MQLSSMGFCSDLCLPGELMCWAQGRDIWGWPWAKEGMLNEGTLNPSLLLFENLKPQSGFQVCGFSWLTEFTLGQSGESVLKSLFLGLKVSTWGITHSVLTTLVWGSRPGWLLQHHFSFQKVIGMFCCLFSRFTHRLGGSLYFWRCKILCKVSWMFVTIL